MRRIADKIEYSPTAIYFHFKDKQAVLRAVCDADFGAFGEQFRKVALIPDAVERLRMAGYGYVEFGLNHPVQYRLMFMTPHPNIDPADSELEKGNPEEDAYAFLKETLLGIRESGRLRPDLEENLDLAAQVIWSGMHGIVSLELAKCNDAWVEWRPMAERSRLMIDVLVAGVTRRE